MNATLPESSFADAELFLGIPRPWRVTQSTRDPASGALDVLVECPPDTLWIESADNPVSLPVDHCELCRWHYHDPCNSVTLRAQVPWLRRIAGHVAAVAVPWDHGERLGPGFVFVADRGD